MHCTSFCMYFHKIWNLRLTIPILTPPASTLKISFYCLLACMVSNFFKNVEFSVFVLPYIVRLISQNAFKIFFLSLVSSI